jgi:hypothetical protein
MGISQALFLAPREKKNFSDIKNYCIRALLGLRLIVSTCDQEAPMAVSGKVEQEKNKLKATEKDSAKAAQKVSAKADTKAKYKETAKAEHKAKAKTGYKVAEKAKAQAQALGG